MQFTAEMIAGLLNGTVVGDKNTTVSTVSSIDGGKEGSLAYLTNPKYEQYVYTTNASIVLVDNTFEPKGEVKTTLIKVANVGECVLNS
jgi:UDP-3-O-[3-hydroxymyristoyl] glucosamine N-acyltransferase